VAAIRLALALLVGLLAAGQALPAGTLAQEVPELEINSERYIVADVETGYVFAQRDARERVPIASLTKVFTAVQAMAMAPLDTPIRTEDSDLRAPEGDYFGTAGTVMGFGAGETYTLEDMLYGMLLPSGNDAANAIARTLGAQPGDTADQAVQRFMDLLNQRLADMGLADTHLVNPHGWGVPGHHSSAWDVAAFARYVSTDQALMDMLGTREYTTSNGLLTVRNTNRLLTQEDSVIGGKTGFDLDAGYCLMNIAGQGDERMVAVTLDGIAPGDWYDDNRVLLEYGFTQKQSVVESGGSFGGDVAAFVDPASLLVARNVAAGASAPEAVVRQDAGQPVPSAAPAPVERSASEQALWVAVVAAVGVIAARGVLTLRWPRRRAAVDIRRADT
jgi:D-alanyl-D-alanine carboxypeptidase